MQKKKSAEYVCVRVYIYIHIFEIHILRNRASHLHQASAKW